MTPPRPPETPGLPDTPGLSDAPGLSEAPGLLDAPRLCGTPLTVPVKLLSPAARLPRRAYEHDAAWDLFAAEAAVLPPLGRAVIGTGIALGLPPGTAALTLPRSGLAARHGISLVNAPGLIDPGYRGEVKVVLLNTDAGVPFSVAIGDRIAQLLLVDLPKADLVQADDVDDTDRGGQGFGSSGRSGEPGRGEGSRP